MLYEPVHIHGSLTVPVVLVGKEHPEFVLKYKIVY